MDSTSAIPYRPTGSFTKVKIMQTVTPIQTFRRRRRARPCTDSPRTRQPVGQGTSQAKKEASERGSPRQTLRGAPEEIVVGVYRSSKTASSMAAVTGSCQGSWYAKVAMRVARRAALKGRCISSTTWMLEEILRVSRNAIVPLSSVSQSHFSHASRPWMRALHRVDPERQFGPFTVVDRCENRPLACTRSSHGTDISDPGSRVACIIGQAPSK